MGNTGWSYSDLTKEACEHGGVDNYINDLINLGKEEGYLQGVIDQRSHDIRIGAAIGAAGIAVWGGIELYRYLKRKQEDQHRVDEVRKAEQATAERFVQSVRESQDNYDMNTEGVPTEEQAI